MQIQVVKSEKVCKIKKLLDSFLLNCIGYGGRLPGEGFSAHDPCRSFDTSEGQWQEVDLPFRNFVPIFRAKTKPDAAPFDSGNVVSVQVSLHVLPLLTPAVLTKPNYSMLSFLQLMLSKFEYDSALNPKFRLGEFALPVAGISAVAARKSAPAAAKFVHVSSAGVTRPGRPGLDLEKVC